MINEKTKNEIVEILDNVVYWESCPIQYKEKIPRLIEALKQVKNIAYEPVLATVKCDCCEKDLTNDSRLCMKCAMTEFK